MPVSLLLIEGHPERAQAVVGALADQWLGWHIEIASTLWQARAFLASRSCDVVVTAQYLPDGSAFDVLGLLQTQPALILVPEGAEFHAAQAMRYGFSDFVVQDDAGHYLLTLPAQIEAVLERSTAVRTRQSAETLLARQYQVLQAISRAQSTFIANQTPDAAFEILLQEILTLTQSRFGLIGQIEVVAGQTPVLHVHISTDFTGSPHKDRLSFTTYDIVLPDFGTGSLLAAALHSSAPFICNTPSSDPRPSGLPAHYPPLTALLALPIHASATEQVAMVVLANRQGGYSSMDVHFLHPLLGTVGQLESARRATIAHLAAQEALCQSEARWRSLTQLSSDWYWEQDANFRFIRSTSSQHPYPDRGIYTQPHYGLTRWELPHGGVTEAQWHTHQAQLEAHEVFHDFELERPTLDGLSIWVSISGEPIFDSIGQFTGYRGVARNITQRKQAEAEIQRLAFYDELTGLPNRRLLLDRLERTTVACGRNTDHSALLFLDLDNFKDINDTLGHEWGDRLLVQAGLRIKGCVRANDTVARLGGDEFVVILQGLHPTLIEATTEAQAIAQKILESLNEPYHLQNSQVHSTPSIGVTLFSGLAQRAHDLLKCTDLAMYQAKAQGRNRVCFFDPGMQAAASARSALEADIRQALQRNEFILHYQPVVDAKGHMLGAEALVRWRHPQRGMVPPGQFITLAEQTGLILQLGRQVLRMACQELALWNAQPERAHWTVAVNVSAQEFRHPDFVDQVLAVLHDTGADSHLLKIELTESLLLHDVEESISKMQALRTLGIGFSLDDFGTGYSSLSYLKRLPLDQLKIDQSFVRDVLTDPNDAAIACTVVALAHSLGLDVVAEGVETQGQYAFLLANGCHRFQGYYFGRPGLAENLPAH